MASHIGVLETWQESWNTPGSWLKRSVAEELVGKGLAVWVSRRLIKKVVDGKLPVKTVRAPKQLGMRVSRWPG